MLKTTFRATAFTLLIAQTTLAECKLMHATQDDAIAKVMVQKGYEVELPPPGTEVKSVGDILKSVPEGRYGVIVFNLSPAYRVAQLLKKENGTTVLAAIAEGSQGLEGLIQSLPDCQN